MSNVVNSILNVFPLASKINEDGHLEIGGIDCVTLANKYGTPLYIFDESNIRYDCNQFKTEFSNLYARSNVIYASKAFLTKAIANIIKSEGIGLDVVSGGELSVAKAVDFPEDKIYFHGNNKTEVELREAIEYGVRHIVVDNFNELHLLNRLASEHKIKQHILLRLTPGIDAHTHKYTTTGIVDSKFGFSLVTGQAEQAVSTALSSSNLNLVGLHCHLGSPIFDVNPYGLAIELMFSFAKEMKNKYKFEMEIFSPGGGFAVQYIRDLPAPAIGEYAAVITASVKKGISDYGLTQPELVIEPGRAIIARSAVALYTVGGVKEIPGVRTFVFVDGGMGDNIRPALYEAKYEALVANKVQQTNSSKVSIAGKYCESGDILIKDIEIPQVVSGDLIAIPVTGAYCIPMSSNYNMVPRPAIVIVKEGKSHLIRKRETYRDLTKTDKD